MRIAVVAVTLFFICLAVQGEEPKEAKPEVNDARFHARLLEIAAKYESYGRVDDEGRWAPWLCDAPGPSMARFSRSGGNEAHGRKLYFLFATPREDFISLTDPLPSEFDGEKTRLAALERLERKVAEGQVVVKESWVPKEIQQSDKSRIIEKYTKLTKAQQDELDVLNGNEHVAYSSVAERANPHAIKGGKLYLADKKYALFIMYKMAPDTPGTDAGWVYGTLSADGKTVTSAGRVASCMDCHASAPHDHLFGIKQQRRETHDLYREVLKFDRDKVQKPDDAPALGKPPER